MENLFLIIIAILPAAALMYFIYWMDRHEPESMGTILAAMGFGALSVIPAVLIQLAFDWVPLFHLEGHTGAFFESFLLVSPSEEFFKFLFVFLYVRKKPFFDNINDGIVFYGAGAIGFALLENIFYVVEHGFGVGFLRAFTAVPIHTFCGIMVGYHAGLARFAGQKHPRRVILRGLFIAYLTHALYNTLVLGESMLSLLVIPLLAVVYLLGYRILHRGRRLSMAAEAALEPRAGWDGDEDLLSGPFSPADSPIREGFGPPGSRQFPATPEAYPAGFTGDPGRAGPVAPPPPDKAALPYAVSSRPTPAGPAPPPSGSSRPEEVLNGTTRIKKLPPRKETWKAVIGRILFGISALAWVLALADAEGTPSERWDIVFGLVIITFIPVMIGLLLELSYRRRKRLLGPLG